MTPQNVDDHGEVLVLPEQDRHVRPSGPVLVQGLELTGDPLRFGQGVGSPVGDHFVLEVVGGAQGIGGGVRLPADVVGDAQDP